MVPVQVHRGRGTEAQSVAVVTKCVNPHHVMCLQEGLITGNGYGYTGCFLSIIQMKWEWLKALSGNSRVLTCTLFPILADHITGSGGKRLRPLLLIISSDLCGYSGDRRFPLASVMEFIHTASLLHDDVIDHAVIRRGKPSANSIWGNSASVLVGDYLYSSSFGILAEDGDQTVQKLLATTTSSMAEGEIIQLAKCGDINATEKDIFRY